MNNKFASGSELHALFKEVFSLEKALSTMVDEIHEQAGMRTSQIRLVNILREHGEATVPDVAHRLNVSRQFVQTMVNELVEQDMVEFLSNPRHKRSKLVGLTAHGKDVLEQTSKREASIIQELLPDIDSENVMSASDLLGELRKRLKLVHE